MSISKNFKNIINDAKNKAVSASKLLQDVKDNPELNESFVDYLTAYNTVLMFEGRLSNFQQILEYWNNQKPSQFVAFLGKNLKDTRKIDGSSLLGSLKSVFTVKELKLLALTSEKVENIVPENNTVTV